MSQDDQEGPRPGKFQALGEYVDRRVDQIRGRLERGVQALRTRGRSLREGAVNLKLVELSHSAKARLEAFAPTQRERLQGAWVVALTALLVFLDIRGHERDASIGAGFLAAIISYAIFANVRDRGWRPHNLRIWGLIGFSIGLYVLNDIFAAVMGAYGAIIGTSTIAAVYIRNLRERKVTPNPFRRLFAAFLLSLLPLGWMAYDYWAVLGDEMRQAEEEISDNLRVRMKPVSAALEREFDLATKNLVRIRKRDELVQERVDEMSRSKAVSLAFFLPFDKKPGNAMFAREGQGVPPLALGPGFSRLVDGASRKLANLDKNRKTTRPGGRDLAPWRETHSSWGEHHMVTQSPRGNGYILAWTIPHEGHYGVVLSQRYLIEQVAAREIEKHHLAGKVRIVNAYRPGRDVDDITLLSSEQMPPHWSFAEALIEPEAFAKAKAAVDSRRLLAQVWFAILVVWLGAAFLNMYRTATRDMALADMKSNFVSSVTHELKTPLGMIRMYSEMLQLGLVGEGKKSEDYLHIITAEADRLARLIDNVLDFSKIQKGTKTYDFADVDLRDVAVAAVRSLEGAFDSSGKDVEVVAPEAIVVKADRDAALQATLNLLSNAVKYGGKHIKVSLTKVGAEVHLDVQDDGSGIPLSEQSNVFMPFYRMGREEERTAPGTGLGLALVKEIMRAHHGSVRLNSQPGLGAIFTLAFPAPVPDETIQENKAA